MAKPPMPAPGAAKAAGSPPMPDDMGDDADAMDAGADEMGSEDEGPEGDVLLTVLKTPDGGYQLIEGDESEEGEGAAEAAKTFDSKGALLKAILDVLNEDESSEGAEGSADDQFQSGFDDNAPPTPAGAMPQKY